MPANPAPSAAPSVLPGITVANQVWELHADPGAIRVWSHVWRELSDSAKRANDRLERRAVAVSDDWEGTAHDAWRDFQFALLFDLRQLRDGTQRHADVLGDVANRLDDAQARLSILRLSAPGACPNVTAVGDSLVFKPLTPDAAHAVVSAVSDAQRVRQDLVPGELPFMAGEWGKSLHAMALGRSKDEDAKSNKFVLPPESHHNAGVIQYKDADGREHVIVNTGAGDDKVQIGEFDATPDLKHPYKDVNRLHVSVNGTDHSFDPGADLTVRTGEGNDQVTVQHGYAGTSAQSSYNYAPAVTIIGGTGDDKIATSKFPDTIVGGPGVNQIDSTGGDYGATPDWVDESPDGGLVER